MRAFIDGAAGATLVETVLGIGITTVILSFVVTSLYQTLNVEQVWRDDALATRDLRHAASYFAGDVVNAQATDLVDGGGAVSSLTLSWTDKDGVPHAAVYSLSGPSLVRNLDGAPIVLAASVVSAGFTLSGGMISLSLEVEAAQGGTQTESYQGFLRSSSA